MDVSAHNYQTEFKLPDNNIYHFLTFVMRNSYISNSARGQCNMLEVSSPMGAKSGVRSV